MVDHQHGKIEVDPKNHKKNWEPELRIVEFQFETHWYQSAAQ
jgi:phage regulator Rha-like protein